MIKIIQKLAPAPPTGLYSPVAPLKEESQEVVIDLKMAR